MLMILEYMCPGAVVSTQSKRQVKQFTTDLTTNGQARTCDLLESSLYSELFTSHEGHLYSDIYNNFQQQSFEHGWTVVGSGHMTV